jgi:glutamyl/glutaminyl-tRNA synthetase
MNYDDAIKERIKQLVENLATDFSPQGFSKSPARFNLKKLNWFNEQYIKKLPLKEFVYRAKQNIGQNTEKKDDINQLDDITDNVTIETVRQYLSYRLDQNRITTLNQLGAESDCILNYQLPLIEDVKWRKNTVEESKQALQLMCEFIKNHLHLFEQESVLINLFIKDDTGNSLSDYLVQQSSIWEENIKKYLTDNNLDFALHLWTLRVALSGRKQSPTPFEILSILSKEITVQRLESVLDGFPQNL